MNFDFTDRASPKDCKRFYSWHEFSTWTREHKTPKNTGILAEEQQSLTVHPKDSWDLGLGLDGALDMCSGGWPQGMHKAEAIAKPIVDCLVAQIERIDLLYDYEGIGIDIPMLLAGEPEHWVRFNTEIVESPSMSPRLISIQHNCTESACIDAESIVRKGAHVMALIQALEFAGHRVELTVLPYSTTTATCAVTIKNFDEPIDPSLTIYALAHPAILRRLGFIFAENMSVAAQKNAGWGYGHVSNPKSDADIKIDSEVGRLDMAWIERQLAKQGIHLKK